MISSLISAKFISLRLIAYKWGLALFLILSGTGSYGENLSFQIELMEDSQTLSLMLFNSSPEAALVSSELGINVSMSGLREVNLIFTDENGKAYYSKHEIRAAPSGRTVLLERGYFIGRRVPLTSLVRYYGLTPGHYYLQAVYCASPCQKMVPGVSGEKLVSNKIEVKIADDGVK